MGTRRRTRDTPTSTAPRTGRSATSSRRKQDAAQTTAARRATSAARRATRSLRRASAPTVRFAHRAIAASPLSQVHYRGGRPIAHLRNHPGHIHLKKVFIAGAVLLALFMIASAQQYSLELAASIREAANSEASLLVHPVALTPEEVALHAGEGQTFTLVAPVDTVVRIELSGDGGGTLTSPLEQRPPSTTLDVRTVSPETYLRYHAPSEVGAVARTHVAAHCVDGCSGSWASATVTLLPPGVASGSVPVVHSIETHLSHPHP